MKTILHKASDRGYANYGWLQANYSFSFANYYNSQKVHFGALRVLNDDLVAPSMGFGTHPHNNMEIITIPLKGVLKHKDSMHNEWQQVLPGEVQVMSAGMGVQHSEINGSPKEHLSLFQLWIIPDVENVEPRYDQKTFDDAERNGKRQVLVSSFNDTHDGSLKIHQDAVISRIDLSKGNDFTYTLKSLNHGVFVMNISGDIVIDGQQLDTRDALGVYDTSNFTIKTTVDSQLLFVEVPMLDLGI